MQARISRKSKSPTQSGKGQKHWNISFPHNKKTFDEVMGWSASNETMPQVELEFDSLEEAKDFAESKGWRTEVIEPKDKKKIVKKSYSDNFI